MLFYILLGCIILYLMYLLYYSVVWCYLILLLLLLLLVSSLKRSNNDNFLSSSQPQLQLAIFIIVPTIIPAIFCYANPNNSQYNNILHYPRAHRMSVASPSGDIRFSVTILRVLRFRRRASVEQDFQQDCHISQDCHIQPGVLWYSILWCHFFFSFFLR